MPSKRDRCANHFWEIAAIACAALAASPAAAQAAGEPIDSIRSSDKDGGAPGGIAGVSFAENFEIGFPLGPCGFSGPWGCVEIIDHPDPLLGTRSLLDRASGSGSSAFAVLSPLFTQETGVTYTDIIINNNSSLFQWIAWSQNAGNTANFFNTRINFEANGTITALQVDTNVPPNCSAGTTASFHATTGTWSPNVKMRIGIEVNAGGGLGSLKLYKDGVVIFSGHDIAQECAPAQAIGISRLRNFNANVGTSTTMVIDNISQDAVIDPCSFPLPFCRGDVDPPGGNDVVNIQDLLRVIATWGQTQDPPGSGPRPAGDCEPLPNGNCVVNIGDLLTVISSWGACPPITGACCANGSCIAVAQAACTAAPNYGVYQGDFIPCDDVVCPVPPPGDLCANAIMAIDGSNAWNNANANLDGPAIAASCLPAGGGGRADVWMRYTSLCTGHVTFDTIGTPGPFTDTLIQVFDTWNCNPVSQLLACNDDINFAANNWLSRTTVLLARGQQVLVRCMSQSASPASNSGAAVLNINCADLDNDFCSQAFAIQLGQIATSTVQNTTPETQPNCLPGGHPLGTGRWYTIIGNNSEYTASTCGSPASQAWDGRIAIYCGFTCEQLQCVAGSVEYDCGPGGLGKGLHESVTWCTRVGQKYWIYVGTDQVPVPPDGHYQLIVTAGSPCFEPLLCNNEGFNDLCANAIIINNGTTTFDTTYANTDGTSNSPPPAGIDCQDNVGTQTVKDIWYRYTATCTGVLTVTTCSNLGGETNFDSDLVLYPGNATCPPTSSQIVACNDDDLANLCGAAPPWASTLRAIVTSGNTYLLRVGGYNSVTTDFGTGILNITCEPATCGNGIIEGLEDCDDQNTNPNDGCNNCVATALCSTNCTYTSGEPCVKSQVDSNSSCNTAEPVPLVDGIVVVCGTLWAGLGTAQVRDVDHYRVTIGPAGIIQAHLTTSTSMPMQISLLRPIPTCAQLTQLGSTVSLTQGGCGMVKANNLPPGSDVMVVVTPSQFTGFPCIGGGFAYAVRVVSP